MSTGIYIYRSHRSSPFISSFRNANRGGDAASFPENHSAAEIPCLWIFWHASGTLSARFLISEKPHAHWFGTFGTLGTLGTHAQGGTPLYIKQKIKYKISMYLHILFFYN
jgi:hypothetical protein